MKFYYITFRSVTYAQRGEKLLNQKNIRCTLQRTPRWMEEKGCGYGLRLYTDRIGEVTGLLRKNSVGFRKIYLLHPNGDTEEIRV